LGGVKGEDIISGYTYHLFLFSLFKRNICSIYCNLPYLVQLSRF